MPMAASALMIPATHSGRLRSASVSSIRSTNRPCSSERCADLASVQLNRADLAPPTWNRPVGDGANRTRTASGMSPA